MDQVIAGVTVDDVDAAAPVDIIVVRATVDQVVAHAAVDLVAAGAAVDLGAAGAVVDDVVHAVTAEQENVGAPCTGHQVIITRITVQPCPAIAFVDEHVVAVAAVQFDIGGHTFLDVDMIVTCAAEGNDLLDAFIKCLAAAELDADDLAAGIAADMFDEINFVARAFGDTAYAVACFAHIEIQHAVRRHRIPQPRITGSAAGQIDMLRQFDVTQREAHRDLDLHEQEFHRGLGTDHQRHTALARRGDIEGDGNAAECDSEGAQFGRTRGPDMEIVFLQARLAGHIALAEAHIEVEVRHQTEAAGAEREAAVQRDIEIAFVIEPAAGTHRRQPEEVNAGIECHPPGTDAFVADFKQETGLEFQHFDKLHFAVLGQQEAVRIHGDAGQGARLTSGVQLQFAGGIDFENLEQIGLDADIQQQRDTRVAAGVDRRAAPGGHAQGAKYQHDIEFNGELVCQQLDGDAAGGFRETEEGDGAFKMEHEALLHRHRGAIGLGQHLLVERADIKFDGCRDIERQADVPTKAARDVDADERGQAVTVDAQHTADIELADAEQLHVLLDLDVDAERVRHKGEFEAAADLHHTADLELALQHEMQTRCDGDITNHEQSGIGIGRKDGRRPGMAGLGVGLERPDGLRAGIGIHLQQELPTQLDTRYGAAVGDGQRHAANDAGSSATEVGIEHQIEAACQGAEVIDLQAHRAGDPDKGVATGIDGSRKRDEAGQRDGVEQRDAALDARCHVELGVCTHPLAAIDLGC